MTTPASSAMKPIRGLIDFYKLQAEILWKWRPGRRALIRRLIVVVHRRRFLAPDADGRDHPGPAASTTGLTIGARGHRLRAASTR